MSSVIYYWTDAQQHGICLFYIIIKKQTTTDKVFFPLSFAMYWKPDFAHFGALGKKPFDVIYCLYKLQQSHWLLCIAKIVIGPGKSRHCQTWLESPFSWNENLQRKQNWTANSTNFKEILEKSSHFLPFYEPKSFDIALKIAGIEKISSENLWLWSTSRPFDSSFEWKQR